MPPRIEMIENKNKNIKTFDDAQRADVNDTRFAKVKRQMTKFSDLIGDGTEKPSIQKAERYRYLTCPHERIEITDENELKEIEEKSNKGDDLEAGKDNKDNKIKKMAKIKQFKYQEYDIFEFNDFGQFGVGIELYFEFLVCLLFLLYIIHRKK